MLDDDFSAFPGDSTVPFRLMKLVTGRGAPRIRVKMEEVGHKTDPRRTQIADFCNRYDLQVWFNPFADFWTIGRQPEPSLFEGGTDA